MVVSREGYYIVGSNVIRLGTIITNNRCVVGKIPLDSVCFKRSLVKRVFHLDVSILWVIFSNRGALGVTLLK